MHVFEKKNKQRVVLEEEPQTEEPVEEEGIQQEQIKCAACGHVRQETDHAPEWQCPCCHVAYAKVTQEYKKAEQQKYRESVKAREEAAIVHQQKQRLGMAGLYAGMFSIISGLGSACNGFSSNPVFKVVGGVIVATSLAYLALNYFS